jgi:hypothetical protein
LGDRRRVKRVKVCRGKAERHIIGNVATAFGSREAVAPTHFRVAVIVIEDVATALVCAAGGCGWRGRGCESGGSGWWSLSGRDGSDGLV